MPENTEIKTDAAAETKRKPEDVCLEDDDSDTDSEDAIPSWKMYFFEIAFHCNLGHCGVFPAPISVFAAYNSVN